MKSTFREFYHNEKVDFNSLGEDILIVFDTNTLLNIYRYSKSTKDTFLKSLEKVKSNIWIPYQVGLEFNFKRREALIKPKDIGDTIIGNINSKAKSFMNAVKEELDSFPIKSIDGQETRKEIISFFNTEVESLQKSFIESEFKKLKDLIDNDDDKMNELADLFEGKVGESFTQEQINKVCEEGEVRYENNIPPGYKDKSKKDKKIYNGLEFETKYGDLILWKQIINRAKMDDKRIVVFVTDDHKEDWWYILKGKNIGARAELKNELKRESGADLILMNTNTFLRETSSSELNSDLVGADITIAEIKSKNLSYRTRKRDISNKFENTGFTLNIIYEKLFLMKKELENLEGLIYKLDIDDFFPIMDLFEPINKKLNEIEKSFQEDKENKDNNNNNYLKYLEYHVKLEKIEQSMVNLKEKINFVIHDI